MRLKSVSYYKHMSFGLDTTGGYPNYIKLSQIYGNANATDDGTPLDTGPNTRASIGLSV